MALLKQQQLVNGWIITKTGEYGTNYTFRALITAIGLGANFPQDAIYPVAELDGNGKPFDAAKRYVMHFDKGQLPPVNGFWSLTMYDGQYFFVPNALNRCTLSERNKLKENADGSVDLYLQTNSPGTTRNPTGSPRPSPASSYRCCGCIGQKGRRRQFWMEPGSPRPSERLVNALQCDPALRHRLPVVGVRSALLPN